MKSRTHRPLGGSLVVLVVIVIAGSITSLIPQTSLAGLSGVTDRSATHVVPSESMGPTDISHALGGGLPGESTASCGQYNCSPTVTGLVDSATGTPYWTNLTSLPSPPPPSGSSMTYDYASHSVLLFGGYNGFGGVTNATWEYSNGLWKNITSTVRNAPPARAFMAMTDDAEDGYVLGFGGSTYPASCPGTSELYQCNDTWSFTGGAWHRIAAVGAPSATALDSIALPTLVYDATDSYTILTNGFSTWKYLNGVWSPFCASSNCTSLIPAPDHIGVAADDAHDGYVLFFASYTSSNGATVGNYTWSFAGGHWTNITATAGAAPPPRINPAMTYDSSTGSVLLFGGETNSSSAHNGCECIGLNDTWSFENGTWHKLPLTTAPPTRDYGAVADDIVDSGAILFGGESLSSSTPLNDTWILGTSPPIAGLTIRVNPATPSPGFPASFSASFRGGVGSYTYSWRFGDGDSSSLANPSHVFATDGHYLAVLWVNDSAGHSEQVSLEVDVYLPLNVSTLRVSPNPAVIGQPVNFTVAASGGTPPYTYAWTFGDGGVGGNLSNITHVYTTNGPFQAEVTVTDAAGGVARSSLNISIMLQAIAGSTSSSGTYPFTVGFVGQAQGGVPPYHYNWSFGDGTTSTLQDPHHTYNSSGRFVVLLTITDSKNNRSSSSLTIQVGGPSAPGPSASEWFAAFVIAVVAAASITAVWGVTVLRENAQRREGERWIEELTSDGPSNKSLPTRPK